MDARNFVGLILIIIGVALQPVGWMYFVSAHYFSIAFIVLGVFFFCTQKYLDSQVESGNARYDRGYALPGDIEGHSGWRSEGKTTAFEHSFSSESSTSGD